MDFAANISVHGFLHVLPVVVLLSVALGARIVAVRSAAEDGTPQSTVDGGVARSGLTGGRVDTVLIDVAELAVHGVVNCFIALDGVLRAREVAVPED